MRRGLELLRGRCTRCLRALAGFAEQWRDQPTLGFTHLQPAQLTTVGKRATLWMQDLVLDLEDIDYRRRTLPFRGVKGTTGTQASFLELFDGDHAKVRQLDRLVTEKMGFGAPLPVTGQTYTRKLDACVLAVVAGIAASAAKFSSDIRMLQSFGEIEEPFESEQIGSSAMAYKRNPMRSERIASLARFVVLARGQREPDARRSVLRADARRQRESPAGDSRDVPGDGRDSRADDERASGLEVHPAVIERRVADELPFMATEELIVRAVRAGGDRQVAHETIRKHSIDAARAIKNGAESNDLLERLAGDKSFGLTDEGSGGRHRPEAIRGTRPGAGRRVPARRDRRRFSPATPPGPSAQRSFEFDADARRAPFLWRHSDAARFAMST